MLLLALSGLRLTTWKAAGSANGNTTLAQTNLTAVGNGTQWDKVETPEPNIWLWVINLRCVGRKRERKEMAKEIK